MRTGSSRSLEAKIVARLLLSRKWRDVAKRTVFRTRPADLRRPVNSIADGLELTDLAAHEWFGLLTYRLAGKTNQLLPD